ncbi:hypothetical protein FKM82_022396 [Ascaphus truei]
MQESPGSVRDGYKAFCSPLMEIKTCRADWKLSQLLHYRADPLPTQENMLCLHLPGKPTSGSLRPFLQPLWPVSSTIFAGLEQDMVRTVGEIKASMKLMDQFHQQLLQEMTLQQNKTLPVPSASDAKSSDGGLVLCLGVQGFSPQELTVKLLGRKLVVTGAKESKSEDGSGSFSYKCQIFRKESDLPRDVRAEELSCTLTSDGQLHVEAPRAAVPAGHERTVPIHLTAAAAAPPAPIQTPEPSTEKSKEADSSDS